MTEKNKAFDPASIQQLMTNNQFEAALTQLNTHLSQQPEDVDALYMAAVCSRYSKQYEHAQTLLNQLLTAKPDHGRAHQEQGHLLLATNKPQEALPAFIRACKFNPALTASWQAQVKLLSTLGNQQQAAQQAQAELTRLQALPKHLIAVTDLLAEGKLVKAENLCRKFLQHNPNNVEAMRLLADIGQRLGSLDEAEFLLESAVVFEPNNAKARIDYIQVLRKRQHFEKALNEAKTLLEQAPQNPQYQSVYAIELMQTGDYDVAIEYFDSVLNTLPNDAITLTSKGHALKTLGQQEQAVTAYKGAITARPQHGEAYYSLANLKIYEFSDDEIALMLAQENNLEHSLMERVYIYFALGKAYEDKKDYAKSFYYYQLGNTLKRNSSGYDADKMSAELKAQQDICTTDLFTAKQGFGCDAPDPIFIVGLPRSGSTMLEQILSSHSQVDGTLELPNILAMAQKLRKREVGYPQALTELTADEVKAMGEAFISETAIHRQGAAFFIDKMPNNFRHIGLIQLILPNAKIIDARRHPMACCFSNYKQLFAEGQEFSYDLNDIAAYYTDYVALMKHWDAVLPGEVLRVNYDEVVEDLEGQVRRVLDFCNLPFEEACLSFHETKRSVRTASSEQVRQPIYRSGLDQWQHYEQELTALQTQLQHIIADYP